MNQNQQKQPTTDFKHSNFLQILALPDGNPEVMREGFEKNKVANNKNYRNEQADLEGKKNLPEIKIK